MSTTFLATVSKQININSLADKFKPTNSPLSMVSRQQQAHQGPGRTRKLLGRVTKWQLICRTNVHENWRDIQIINNKDIGGSSRHPIHWMLPIVLVVCI
jgi:hypothetical protein